MYKITNPRQHNPGSAKVWSRKELQRRIANKINPTELREKYQNMLDHPNKYYIKLID